MRRGVGHGPWNEVVVAGVTAVGAIGKQTAEAAPEVEIEIVPETEIDIVSATGIVTELLDGMVVEVQLEVVVVQGVVVAVGEGNGTTMAAMRAVVVAEAMVLTTTLSQVAIGRWRSEWDFELRMTEFSLHAQTQTYS